MVESERIYYIRKKQNILRAETFANLTEATLSGEVVNNMIGNRTKLPASFTGSARYMIEKYCDVMALCRVYGYLDIFITFTCNSKWPEIRRALEGTGFYPENKPAYQSRMFKIKLYRLMEDIKKIVCLEGLKLFNYFLPATHMFLVLFKHITIACPNNLYSNFFLTHLYTIEFQKRGLPHAHICIFLDERDKLPEPKDVDKFISAEIPDKDVDPELYQLVSDLMIHGPCGDKNPSCPCTDIEKKHTKNFPKPFADCTTVDKEGYPIYKRTDNGRKVIKQGHDLDNGSVVPYNAVLLKKYHVRINVEWCNQLGAIRYLFKYINKGNDRVTAGGCDEVTDEVKEYYDCRYVSSCEAVWCMLSFDIHNRNPTVIRLAFHLPDQHSVIFDEEDLVENVLDSESVNRSQFLEWMNMNRVNEDARQLSYLEFVWNKETKLWSPKNVFTGTIGRIHHVSPQTGELLFLRILLNKVKGPTSYEDIRNVNGQLCPTFKDACYEMGLLDDDQEYIDGIKEASSWGGGHFVRNLICQLLTSESLSRQEVVFDEAFEYLSVDIIHHRLSDIQPTLEMLKNLTLNEIAKLLLRNGKSLKNYPSMPYPSSKVLNLSDNPFIIDELSYNMPELEIQHAELIDSQNTDKKKAYNTIVSAVAADKGGAFFVYAALRSRGQIVLNVASSGIAAFLLPGGRTAHSRFENPIDPKDES
ncbi:uncharacterized protein [Rutidosis leptorrhynchoides]|uniref:uncharacterized protein n=1 Tax=Rutidosis leptorrhynchoides TaxID=125765 RepID=UPI003A9A54D7